VKVAKLNLTENEELEEVLKIQEFPTVLFYPAGVKKVDGALKFSGTKKKFSLVEWLVKNNQENTGKSELEELTAENYKQVCKGGKGTCVIAFLENTDDEEVVKGLTALAGSYLKKPVSFFYALKSKQEALAKQFGV
jgi:thioredoxin-like negative regulator of GroEL